MKKIDFTAWFLSLALLGLLSFSHVSDSWAGGITSPGAARGRNADITSLQNLHGSAGIVTNTVAGTQALDTMVNGSNYNSAFGYHAGYGVTTGTRNNFFGYNGGLGVGTTAYSNNAFGNNALEVVTGYQNNAFGDGSLSGVSSGYGNSCFGNSTCQSMTTGAYNTFVGAGAGGAQSVGNYNAGFGDGAYTGNGGYNLCVGHNCYIGGNGSNNVVIGDNAYLGSGSAKLVITASTNPTATPLISGAFDMSGGATGSLNINGSFSVLGQPVAVQLTGATASIGGAALAADACASGTVAITGATTGMVVAVSPATYPGAGFDWGRSYVSAAGVVTVQVCADVAGTPTASVYNVRVIQ